ncbi:LsmAD domain-containing protein [Fomitopsis serialis]|uniref:LsmAD domain-containing protein n=1 Tax=Fomitopsis serialis TaxID=139415 RepID=UPI00200793F0|nr:LsmAD domain-containing protein [Neoantrodia serialis]KAH9917828.1 LsmAD domain-containing protein [Neoantrodia serialis]
MATTARQPKPQRKGGVPEPAARRAPAWSNSRASPTFSPNTANAPWRLPAFGPAERREQHSAPADATRPPQDRILSQLSGLVGTTITLTTKTHVRYEGSVASTSGEGDTTGVTLRDVKEISNPGAPLRDILFIASTNIDQWSSGPADAKPPTTNGANGDSFKTDTDITKTAGRRERELQAWQPADEAAAASAASGAPAPTSNGGTRDDQTFGPGAANGGAWNQFEVNERLFGVKANFDEDLYTTKLDRNAPDFKERERWAAGIANEILQSQASNVHIAEERTKDFVGEGKDEEEKYGAVVRSANAYVPPGARKTGQAGLATPAGVKDVPRVAVNAPDGTAVAADKEKKAADAPKTGSPAPGANKPTADAVPAFRDFVSNEKDRLMKKKQALMKNEMERRMAELVKFSQSFKVRRPFSSLPHVRATR